MTIDFETMTIDELAFSLIEIEEQLQQVMSLILLTKAMIKDLEIEKIEMAKAEKLIQERKVSKWMEQQSSQLLEPLLLSWDQTSL